MRISNFQSPNFEANFNSPKLRFKQEDFFVRIRGFGKDTYWANSVKSFSDQAVNWVRRDISAENVLKLISVFIKNINFTTGDIMKRQYSGILRTKRENWPSLDRDIDSFTPYLNNKYRGYSKRFEITQSAPLHSKKGISLSRPKDGYIEHGNPKKINNAMDRVFKLTEQVFPKYIHKDIKPRNLPKVNSVIAEIRWIMAHSTPWTRGSDAISNVFMRVMYKAIGVKTYPIKKGISLDLEAYCTELKDYKKKFASYFDKPPEIVD